jgi:hypothetical protein
LVAAVGDRNDIDCNGDGVGAVRDMGYGDGDVARYGAKGNINIDGDRKLKLSYGRSG